MTYSKYIPTYAALSDAISQWCLLRGARSEAVERRIARAFRFVCITASKPSQALVEARNPPTAAARTSTRMQAYKFSSPIALQNPHDPWRFPRVLFTATLFLSPSTVKPISSSLPEPPGPRHTVKKNGLPTFKLYKRQHRQAVRLSIPTDASLERWVTDCSHRDFCSETIRQAHKSRNQKDALKSCRYVVACASSSTKREIPSSSLC